MAKPRMVAGREQEADAGFVQRLSRHLRRHVELRAQLLQYIGRSAARRDRAVAVLRHRQSRRRRDEGDRGRDVDRTGAVPARAAGVGEEIVRPFERRVEGATRPREPGRASGREEVWPYVELTEV